MFSQQMLWFLVFLGYLHLAKPHFMGFVNFRICWKCQRWEKRVADIKTASENLSDFIVIGRPIYRAEKKREIVERILGEIERLK